MKKWFDKNYKWIILVLALIILALILIIFFKDFLPISWIDILSTFIASVPSTLLAKFWTLLKESSGFIGVVIAIITLLLAFDGIKRWKVDKMIDIRYKFKEERTLFLDKISKETDVKKTQILYLDLLNELELISLLHQEDHLEDPMAKDMFNTWIKNIYELDWIPSVICEKRMKDSKAYENT